MNAKSARATIGRGLATDRVIVGDETAGYCTPWRGPGGTALAVVLPRTIDDVLVAMDNALTVGCRIVVQGANTGLVGAATPSADADMIVMNLTSLAPEVAVDPANRTASVSAGTRLSALNEACLPHGLRFPVELSADPSVGGVIATNAGGANVLRYANAGRSVLGVDVCVADPSPRHLRSSSPVRKTAIGPPWWPLFIGSDGQFGVVTRALVELVEIASDEACAFVALDSLDDAVALVVVLRAELGPQLVAFETISANALRFTTAAIPNVHQPWGALGPPAQTCLIGVETFGRADATDVLAAALDAPTVRAALRSSARHGRDPLLVPKPEAWHLRHSVSEGLARTGHVIAFDLGTTVARLPALRDAVAQAVADRVDDGVLAEFGHCGDGGLHCNIVMIGPEDDRAATGRTGLSAGRFPADQEAAIRDIVYEVATQHGATFSSEHGIGPLNRRWWNRYVSSTDRELFRSLKQLFDPHNLFGHPL